MKPTVSRYRKLLPIRSTPQKGIPTMTDSIILASRWKRLIAFLIDASVIKTLGYGAVALGIRSDFFSTSDPEFEIQTRGLVLLIAMIYFTLFTLKWNATLGKLALGIKVTDNDGKPLPIRKILLRELLLKWLTMGLLGHLWLLFNKKKKTAWDYLAGSLVVQK